MFLDIDNNGEYTKNHSLIKYNMATLLTCINMLSVGQYILRDYRKTKLLNIKSANYTVPYYDRVRHEITMPSLVKYTCRFVDEPCMARDGICL